LLWVVFQILWFCFSFGPNMVIVFELCSQYLDFLDQNLSKIPILGTQLKQNPNIGNTTQTKSQYLEQN
jgi:hypothetical protein